jgi:hypothetical protein
VWSTADICHKSEEKHGNIYGKSSENDGTWWNISFIDGGL